MAGLIMALGRRDGWAAGVVRRVAPRLAHYPWLTVRSFDAGRFALGLVQHEDVDPPVWRTTSAPQVVVFGELVDDAGSRLPDDLVADAAAERWGALRTRNGCYNLVVWDGRRGRLVVATDATGALLLFRTRCADGWIWSSEPGALPRSGALDETALRSLARIGYQADHRTLDPEITAVPAATVEVVDLDDGRHERHSGLPAPSADAGAAWSTVVQDAVQRRLAGVEDVDVALTGGLDSRLLLAAVQTAGRRLRTFTLATGDPRELRLARQVAATAGVPHDMLAREPRPVRRHHHLMRSAIDTTSDWHMAEQLAVCGAARPGRAIVLGFLGGTITGSFVDRRSAAAGLSRMRRDAASGYLGEVDAEAIAWCDVPGAGARVPEVGENLYGRQRRYIGYLVRLAWNFGRPVTPFTDVRLVSRALAASRGELAGRTLRPDALRRSAPHLATIATSDDRDGLGPGVPRALRTIVRRTHVMRPVRALVPRPLGYDRERLRPLADECRQLVGDARGHRLLDDLSPMATLALAPVLMASADRPGHPPPVAPPIETVRRILEERR